MSRLRRKITFQLVPLLDLMLIVVFAQFMEVRQSAERQAQRAVQAVEESESAEQLRQAAAAKLKQIAAEHDQLMDENGRLSAELEKRRVETETALSQAREERDRIAGLMSELFKVPDNVISQVLAASTPDQVSRVKKALTNLPGARSGDFIRQVLTIDQLQRSCDIWEVHVDDNSVARVSNGRDSSSFRADTPTEFEKNFYDWYKSLPPPKTIVIIQVSWSDATLFARDAARLGIIPTIDRMRTDRNGQTVFEYVVLGFKPGTKP